MPSITSIKMHVGKKLRDDRNYRTFFFRKTAQDEIAMQIRKLRESRGLKQKSLADKAGMKQSAISRIEQAEYEGWTFKTLFRIADALEAQLQITFKPIEQALEEYQESDSWDMRQIMMPKEVFPAAASGSNLVIPAEAQEIGPAPFSPGDKSNKTGDDYFPLMDI